MSQYNIFFLKEGRKRESDYMLGEGKRIAETCEYILIYKLNWVQVLFSSSKWNFFYAIVLTYPPLKFFSSLINNLHLHAF